MLRGFSLLFFLVGVYDERNNKQTMILEGHSGGVTQIKFHPDGNLLLSGARKVSQAVTKFYKLIVFFD